MTAPSSKAVGADKAVDTRLVYQAKARPQGISLTLKRPYWQVATSDGKGVAYVFGDDDENVRRLVACWNYMDGLATGFIEAANEHDDTTTEMLIRERDAWREFAEHLWHCLECGLTGPESCADGNALKTAATTPPRSHAGEDEGR